jgi:HPt (histidine-containing phosphotransfer) domain-containing protein
MEFTKNDTSPYNETISDQQHIDLDSLKKIARGDTAFLLKLIDHFLLETPQSMQKIEVLLEEGNYREIRDAAHKIKPSLSFMGVPKVENEIRKVEELSSSGTDPEELRKQVQSLKASIGQIISELKEERQKLIT